MDQETKHKKLVELHDELLQLKEIKRRAKACGCPTCRGHLLNFKYTVKAYSCWGVGTPVRSYQKKWMRTNWKYWWAQLDKILQNPKHIEKVVA